jgi:ZIP family zinc transporter
VAESFAWGVAAASSLLLGGALALRFRISTRLLGLVMAFGSGVLISALAFELVQEAVDTSAGDGGVALGLFAGSLVFFAGDLAIDRIGGADRKSSSGTGQEGGSAMGIVLGIVLDGVPESMVIGLTIVEGGAVSVAYLAAVFMSNLPEALAASTGLRAGGWTKAKVMLLWLGVTGVSGVSALLGFVLLEDASPRTVAIVLSFAGGAILTMLAETMMPEAFKHGGKLVGVFTTLGFALAFAIGALE